MRNVLLKILIIFFCVAMALNTIRFIGTTGSSDPLSILPIADRLSLFTFDFDSYWKGLHDIAVSSRDNLEAVGKVTLRLSNGSLWKLSGIGSLLGSFFNPIITLIKLIINVVNTAYIIVSGLVDFFSKLVSFIIFLFGDSIAPVNGIQAG